MSLVIMDEDLYRSISKISSHSYFMPVGRAAWAIFASLKIHNTDKKQVIAMPSFVCQSVVAAAVASGWEIVFLDINLNNANVNSDEYLRAIQKHKIDAVLFVHLLGNKNELNGLQSECRKNGILLIEDSAQFCDQHDIDNYTELSCIKIFSFGYSKPIDAGGGGILCTDDKSIIMFSLSSSTTIFSTGLITSGISFTGVTIKSNVLLSSSSPSLTVTDTDAVPK